MSAEAEPPPGAPPAPPAPLMWSQEMYWYIYRMPLPEVDSVKTALCVPAPHPGVSQATALAAVRSLMLRHEALRTLCPTDAHGIPFQSVRTEFEVPVPLRRQGDDPADIRAVIDELAGPRLDQAVDLPLRVGLTLHGDQVATVVLLLNHIAVDKASAPILTEDLTRLLDAPATCAEAAVRPAPCPAEAPRGLQPAEQARRQALGSQTVLGARALRYWEEVLRELPAAPFPWSAPAAGAEHYHQAVLRSRPLLTALHRLGRRERSSACDLLATAFCLALSALSGNSRVAFKMNFSNRFPEVRQSVGCFFQEALVHVEAPGRATVGELAARTQQRLLAGSRHARYSYLDCRDTRARVEAARGLSFRLATSFDCADGWDQRPATVDGIANPASEEESSLSRRTCEWQDDYNDLFFRSYPQDDAAVLDLVVHTSVAGRAETGRLLHGMERFLIAWAEDPRLAAATVTEAVERFALPVTRYGDGWVLVDHCWVDAAALARLLCAVDGVTAAALVVRERPGHAPVLVAQVTGPGARRPELRPDLRAALLTALRRRRDVVCPHEFVWCERLPQSPAPIATAHRPATDNARPLVNAPSGEPGSPEQRFVTALAAALGPGPVDLDACYAEQGGRAVLAAAVIERLEQLGCAGPTPDDLLGPWPLRSLAALCTPHPE